MKMTRQSYGIIADISCTTVATMGAFYSHDWNNLSAVVAKLTHVAAMSCLHHINFFNEDNWCSIIPKDIFTFWIVSWLVTSQETQFICLHLHKPINVASFITLEIIASWYVVIWCIPIDTENLHYQHLNGNTMSGRVQVQLHLATCAQLDERGRVFTGWIL